MSSKDRHALQAIMEQADLIGHAPDGSAFLLVRTTPELLAYLAEAGAATEDDEGSEAEGEQVEFRKAGSVCPSGFMEDDEPDHDTERQEEN